MGILVAFLSPERDRENECIRQAAEAGGWVARVGCASLLVIIISAVMLVRVRSVPSATRQGARAGAPVEPIASGRRIAFRWAMAIVFALVATGHRRNDAGRWELYEHESGGRVELASVGCFIDVDEVYRDPLAAAGAS
jgi:hypothetical protein